MKWWPDLRPVPEGIFYAQGKMPDWWRPFRKAVTLTSVVTQE